MPARFLIAAAAFAFVRLVCGAASADFATEPVEVRGIGPGGGGWLECTVASRHSPGRILVGCDVGGFYLSEDGGRTYEIRNRGLHNFFVEAIAEHPRNPDLLLLGGHDGVYRSTDRGAHWTHVAEGLPTPRRDGHALYVTALQFDETDPDHVWMASGGPRAGIDIPRRLGRVWESRDAGLTWRQTIAADEDLLKDERVIAGFSADFSDPKRMLLANSRGVWRSEDGGRHWRPSNGALPVGKGYFARRFARSPAKPSVVYVSLRQNKGGAIPLKGGIWRSDDGGATWTPCAEPKSSELQNAGKFAHHFWSDAVIAVDARDPDVLWAGGSCWFVNGVWKSTDGGRSWNCAFNGPHQGWIDFWGIHTASLAASFRFPDTAVFGTSGVAYRTADGGRVWRQCYTADRKDGKAEGCGLETLCVRGIWPSAVRPDRFYVGFWDMGLMITDDNGRSFSRSVKGVPPAYVNSCFTLVQSPTDEKRLFATFGRWATSATDPKPCCTFATSADGGLSWTTDDTAPGWLGQRATALVLMNDREPYALACGATEGDERRRGIMVSEDSGKSWTPVPESALPYAADVKSLAYADGVLWAGLYVTSNHVGRVCRSRDRGRTWETVLGARKGESVGAVYMITPHGETIVAATHAWGRGGVSAYGGIWVSRDRGETWKKTFNAELCTGAVFGGETLVTASSPSPYRDPGFDRNRGVFASRDCGETWTRLEGPLFDMPMVNHLAADPFRPGTFWVGTSGNSIFAITTRPRDKNAVRPH